jgi:hypothetical protein
LLKQIVHHSAKLITFLALLQMTLSKPQRRHIRRITDAVIVCDMPHKTLSGLYRHIVDAPDASNAADCLRISPWEANDVNKPRRDFVMRDLLRYAEETGQRKVFVSIDDSLTGKDKGTRHLEPVEFHYDHTKSTRKKASYTNGVVHVEVRVQIGDRAYAYDYRIYMREKTVRRLNRKRAKENRLRFRSKYNLAREILVDLQTRLPKGYQVYVLFDSWYASNKLLKFCRRQGWHCLCAIKSNRVLDGKKLSQWNKTLKHRRYQQVTLTAANRRTRTYQVRVLRGKLNNFPDEVCVIISKRHPGDKCPKYFLCTDLSPAPQAVLTDYQKRWPVEVDNFYVKQFLGLGDFRLRSYQAIEKWYAIVFLAFNYLQWRLNHEHRHFNSLADVVREHRCEHAQSLLEAACRETLRLGSVIPVFKRFIYQSEPAPT